MAERSRASQTVPRTKCARCPGGTNSCTEGGKSQPWSTSHKRNTLAMSQVNHPATAPSRRLLGQAPSLTESQGRVLGLRRRRRVCSVVLEERRHVPARRCRQRSTVFFVRRSTRGRDRRSEARRVGKE